MKKILLFMLVLCLCLPTVFACAENTTPPAGETPGEETPGDQTTPGGSTTPGGGDTEAEPGDTETKPYTGPVPGVGVEKEPPALRPNDTVRTEATEEEITAALTTGPANYTMWTAVSGRDDTVYAKGYTLVAEKNGKTVCYVMETVDGVTTGRGTFFRGSTYYSGTWDAAQGKWLVSPSQVGITADPNPLHGLPIKRYQYDAAAGMYDLFMTDEAAEPYARMRLEDGVLAYVEIATVYEVEGEKQEAVMQIFFGDVGTTEVKTPLDSFLIIQRDTTENNDDNTEPPAEGGETEPPAEGGETEPPVEGGETEPPVEGGETEPPVEGGETEPPVEGGETEPPAEGGETEPPAEGGETEPPAPNYGIAVGDTLAPFSVATVNGKGTFSLEEQKENGRVTVINFFGTWCYYCMEEMPYLDDFATEYADRLTVLALHSQSGSDTLAGWIAAGYADSDILFAQDAYDVLYDRFGGGRGWPFTVIVDETGEILYSFFGAPSYDQWVSILQAAMTAR